MQNVGVTLLNGEEWLEFPRPLIRGAGYLGEVGMSKKKYDYSTKFVLNSAWEEIVNSDSKGLILFSLGSVANTTWMPDSMMMGMLKAFSRFPDYTVIWKTERTIPGVEKYKHIHTVPWTPQPLLLGHPNFKLFITHCGYNSFLEGVHAGVPILALPLWADQILNAQKAVRMGSALALDKMNMKKPKAIADAINTLVTNPRCHLVLPDV